MLARRVVRYAARPKVPVESMPEYLRFTRLGAALREHAATGADDAAHIAQAVLSTDDLTPLHALRDYMLDNPDHPLARKFNWERLPEKVRLDNDLRNWVVKNHGNHAEGELWRISTGIRPKSFNDTFRHTNNAINGLIDYGHKRSDWEYQDIADAADRVSAQLARERGVANGFGHPAEVVQDRLANLQSPSRQEMYARRGRPVRKAKADTRHAAHPLVAGFPIETALRHLANDPDNSRTVRDLAKTALTGGDSGDGTPMALWLLHDALSEHENKDGSTGHPALKWYNWMSAADKVQLDQHTHRALDEAATDTRRMTGHGYQGNITPEHHAWRAAIQLATHPQVAAPRPARDAGIVDYLRRRVPQLSPGATEKDVDESIRRHFLRAQRAMLDTPTGQAHVREMDAAAVRHPGEKNPGGRTEAYHQAELAARYRRPRRYALGSELAGFHSQMHDGDLTAHKVYADWLADQGHETLAATIRGDDEPHEFAINPPSTGDHLTRLAPGQFFGRIYRDGDRLAGHLYQRSVARPTQVFHWATYLPYGHNPMQDEIDRANAPARYRRRYAAAGEPAPAYPFPGKPGGTIGRAGGINEAQWAALAADPDIAHRVHNHPAALTAGMPGYSPARFLHPATADLFARLNQSGVLAHPDVARDRDANHREFGRPEVVITPKMVAEGRRYAPPGAPKEPDTGLVGTRVRFGTDEFGRRAVTHVFPETAASPDPTAARNSRRRYAMTLRPGVASRHASGEEMFTHAYHDEAGARRGVVRVIPRNDGRTLHVEWAGPETVGPGEEKNTLGGAEVNNLRSQLTALYPQARFLTGLRGGGVSTGAPRRVVVPVPGRMRRRELLRRLRYAKGPQQDFLAALRRVRSTQSKALHRVATDVARKLGLDPADTVPALHDGPGGSVSGIAQAVYGRARPEDVHAAAAWYGLTGRLPGVAVFHVRPAGPDALHKFHAAGSGHALRERLDRAGVADRVLIPHRSGYDVMVPDPGGRLARPVAELARQMGSPLESSRGHFKVIGAADMADARAKYRGLIETQERMSRKPRRYALQSGLEGFHAKMHAEPGDRTTFNVYADWLQDQGHDGLAGIVREDDSPVDTWVGTTPPHINPGEFAVFPYPDDAGTESFGYQPPPPGRIALHVKQRSAAYPQQAFWWSAFRTPEEAARIEQEAARANAPERYRRYSAESNAVTLKLKDLRQRRESAARLRAAMHEKPPAELADRLVAHLRKYGPRNRRQIVLSGALTPRALDVAAAHARQAGTVGVETRDARPAAGPGGNRPGTWYSLKLKRRYSADHSGLPAMLGAVSPAAPPGACPRKARCGGTSSEFGPPR